MYLSFRFFLLVLLATAVPLFGCSPKDRYFAPWIPPEEPKPIVQVGFVETNTVVLGLREKRYFEVQTDPPGVYELNFLLIGDALDGSLDRTLGITDESGRAGFWLQAPNLATTFSLRVRLSNESFGELPISVSGDGFADLIIKPEYHGKRTITDWTAIAVARKSCSEVAPMLPDDPKGALFGYAPVGETLIVHDAPVGPIIAVAVRAGHFAWGCTTTSDLIANEPMKVKVNIIDKPAVVEQTDLDVTLGFVPDQGTYADILNEINAISLDAFFPADSAQASTRLLDEMIALSPEADAAALTDARAASGWDQLTTDHLAAQPTSLRGAFQTWFTDGFAAEPPEIEGRLRAMKQKGFARFDAIRMGSIDPVEAGFPQTHLMKMAMVGVDRLGMVGTFSWFPSLYAVAVATKAALAGKPEGTTIVDVLAEVAACDALATTLVGTATCDATCLSNLCRGALESRYQHARAATAENIDQTVATITMNAIGDVLVDDTAVPIAIVNGQWLGIASYGQTSVKISNGSFTATPGKDPEPPL